MGETETAKIMNGIGQGSIGTAVAGIEGRSPSCFKGNIQNKQSISESEIIEKGW